MIKITLKYNVEWNTLYIVFVHGTAFEIEPNHESVGDLDDYLFMKDAVMVLR